MNLIRVVCTSLLTLVLITAIGCAGSSTEESAGEYLDDSWITTRLKTALAKDPDVKAVEVNVETFKGVVQLSGFVESQEAMNKAMEIARSTKGVNSVKNAMRVK